MENLFFFAEENRYVLRNMYRTCNGFRLFLFGSFLVVTVKQTNRHYSTRRPVGRRPVQRSVCLLYRTAADIV